MVSTSSEYESNAVRSAAKIRLLTPDHKLVFVEGPSGRANLLGGGIEPGQTVTEALLDELDQEAGITENDIINLRTREIISGPVNVGRAQWHMHDGRLIDDHHPLTAGAEIQRIFTLTPPEAINYTGNMSELARLAIINKFLI